MEPEISTPTDINILGEYNLAGEFWQVKPLLEKLGVRVHCCITGDARFSEVASAHRSKVNMMVCSAALINLARKMEERWGIPYFEGSFYGVSDTSDALRNIAGLLVRQGAPHDLIARTESLIAQEEARVWERLKPYRDRLKGKRVLLYTGGVKSWSVVSALMEVGVEIVDTSLRKTTLEDKQRIKELLGDDPHVLENMAPRDMYAFLKEGKADIMLSGGRTQFIALKARTPWLDINQERHDPFAGYDGMVELVKKLDATINNPVWAKVRAPAPWDQSGALAVAGFRYRPATCRPVPQGFRRDGSPGFRGVLKHERRCSDSEIPLDQSAQEFRAAWGRPGLARGGRRGSAVSWLARLHGFRPRSAGAPFQGNDSAPDHRDERGFHHRRRRGSR